MGLRRNLLQWLAGPELALIDRAVVAEALRANEALVTSSLTLNNLFELVRSGRTVAANKTRGDLWCHAEGWRGIVVVGIGGPEPVTVYTDIPDNDALNALRHAGKHFEHVIVERAGGRPIN